MSNIKKIFNQSDGTDDWGYTRNEILERISSLYIDCPECESIIHSDEQYQCNTCGGGARINVLSWMKSQIENFK